MDLVQTTVGNILLAQKAFFVSFFVSLIQIHRHTDRTSGSQVYGQSKMIFPYKTLCEPPLK